MAAGDSLTILDHCRISPPPNAVGHRSLPLTFFDFPWLLFPPVHQLFFYEFPHSKHHFIQTIIPNLKHSLTITLQHFFPFASNLLLFLSSDHPSVNRKPEIRHTEGDSIPLTFAESGLDFDDLIANHPRDCRKFYPLVPLLEEAAKASDFVKIPLFSIQITIFPNAGIAIGLTNHHILCDASTRFDFLKVWTSIARNGTDELFLATGSLPFYDRTIKYPEFLDDAVLSLPAVQNLYSGYKPAQLVSLTDDKVRVTLVLTRAHINGLKKWLSGQEPRPEYMSSFSVACAFVWTCIAKSRAEVEGEKGVDELERFNCVVDWRTRLDPPLPQTYFGNCVGPCIATTKSSFLTGNKGFVIAAELFGNAISQVLKNKDRVLKEAETWLESAMAPFPTIGVAGTPKIKVYDLDFGWGKPKKYETISIDYSGSISVNACKESPEDLEIGLSLPPKQMEAFVTISGNELEGIISKKN